MQGENLFALPVPEDHPARAVWAYVDGLDLREAYGAIVPVKAPRNPKSRPFTTKPGDGPGVVAWRARMGTPEAHEIYQERASTAEWSNAHLRNRGLVRLTVRGLKKVRAVVLLYALVHNLFTGLQLRRLALQTA